MSVPTGTLTDDYRASVLGFFGRHFGWTELTSLRLPDRMTIRVGGGSYLNIREREHAAAYSGYEHFGLALATPEAVEAAREAIEADPCGASVEPLERGPNGYRQFRLAYLLPMTVEVQHLPAGSIDP